MIGRSSESEIFAITAPGLEPITASELKTLGIDGRTVAGGVEWRGGSREVYRACLHLRTASRVVVRVARFRARGFIEFERHLKRVEWSPFFTGDVPITLRVTSSKSRLYHERAIAERLTTQLAASGYRVLAGRAAADDEPPAPDLPPQPSTSSAGPPEDSASGRAGAGTEGRGDGGSGGEAGGAASRSKDEPGHSGESGEVAQLVIVRFHRDECIISVDAAGALLHRRGYRQAVARAPLRETIAAAMLLGCGWKVGAPLLDPLCGSGTIPIEAALIARNIAPGLANPERQARDYAFQRWPLFEPRTWEEVVGEARTQISGGPLSFIGGSDRDAGAVASAIANARRAGVAEDLHVRVAAVSDMECAGDSGWIVTNPPYGIRVGESAPLRNLYAALGRAIRTRCGGWSLAMLSADPRLAGAVGTEWREVLRTSNGGLPVHLLVSRP